MTHGLIAIHEDDVNTDGYGPAPHKEPTWCKTIWLLTGAGAPVPATWGEAIHIDDVEEKDS